MKRSITGKPKSAAILLMNQQVRHFFGNLRMEMLTFQALIGPSLSRGKSRG
jgi:hypothetical protein